MAKYISSKKYPGIQLYHKSDGDVSYSIRIKDLDGKTQRIKIGYKSQGITETYCNKKRNELLLKLRLGENDPLLKTNDAMTLNEAATIFYQEKALFNKDNQRQHGKYIRMFQDSLGLKPLNKITEADIKAVQKELLLKQRQANTINGYTGMLKGIFNYCIQERLYRGSNPAQYIKRYKEDNKRERFLSKDEIALLLNEVKENKVLTIFVIISLRTGGRYNTIRHIQKKHLNFENRTITLYDIKNDSTYTGFIDTHTTEMLKEYVQGLGPNDYIFTRGNDIYKERSLQRHLKAILDRLFNQGLDKKDSKNRVVVHTLRHTFASHLAMQGTPLLTIQKLMNHKDIDMTMRYAKLAPDAGKDAVDLLYKI